MRVFARRIELARYMAIQCSHDADAGRTSLARRTSPLCTLRLGEDREVIGESIGFALDLRPFNGLAVVSTPKRHFSPAEHDDDIAFG